MVQFLTALILTLLILMCVFLICLVLIQRGKGGGLAGAFGGGAGSSSAFGTKAGDVFTRVTMITAGIWIATNMILVILSNQRTSAWNDTPATGSANKSAFSTPTDKNAPADKTAPGTPGTPGVPNTGAASPFDALAPANPNAPAPSPLGTGAGTTSAPTPGPSATTPAPGTGTAAGSAVKKELPDSPFEASPTTPVSPLPAGSTPSGGGNNPKP